jgi:hypothetical protein
MLYRYPVFKFDLPLLLKNFFILIKCDEDGYVENGDCIDVPCKSVEDLFALGGRLYCLFDLSSYDFLLEEYQEFCETEVFQGFCFIKKHGITKWAQTRSMGKKRNWQYDFFLFKALSEGYPYIAVRVILSGNCITIESGYDIGDSDRERRHFQRTYFYGIPEIDVVIKDLVSSCCLKL